MKKITIYDCIKHYQQKKNINDYQKCQKCKSYLNIFQQKLYRPANYMIFVLNNNLNNFSKFENLKTIDLKDYIDDKNYISTSYRLVGACIHNSISNNFGHYTSVCLNNNNDYYLFNDSISTKVFFDYIKNTFPYILFYERIIQNTNNIIFSMGLDDQEGKNYINKIIRKLQNLFNSKTFQDYSISIGENFITFIFEKSNSEFQFKIGDDYKLKMIFNIINTINQNKKFVSPNYKAKLVFEYQLTFNIDNDFMNIKDIIKDKKVILSLLSNNKINFNI
jgi:hypothetical protein